jgi:hypothetical protein
MLLRAHFRGVDVNPGELLLSSIFEIDQKMRAALPNSEGFSYVSVLDAVRPQRQCPLTVAGGIPLTVDHAHLTAEGSAYVSTKLMPSLGLKGKKSLGARLSATGANGLD